MSSLLDCMRGELGWVAQWKNIVDVSRDLKGIIIKKIEEASKRGLRIKIYVDQARKASCKNYIKEAIKKLKLLAKKENYL